jgi:hypothetical protein
MRPFLEHHAPDGPMNTDSKVVDGFPIRAYAPDRIFEVNRMRNVFHKPADLVPMPRSSGNFVKSAMNLLRDLGRR